eukprot:CAMPEP_0181075018 /NCGR_PEP_ID=MMETSP1070-20121207/29893_1 /TAXON_ID=265543 /ORGANISM="Minutocellus polymorphus, Strain NH13" /LENGTH=80 /DNA_ID=CAMNT_0023156137 /DNA_START=1201 /DNA_END=1439 /DNA_ORIENTATION=-
MPVCINLYALLVQQMYAAPEARVGRTPAVRVIYWFRLGIASDGIVLVPPGNAGPGNNTRRCPQHKSSCQEKGGVRRSVGS